MEIYSVIDPHNMADFIPLVYDILVRGEIYSHVLLAEWIYLTIVMVCLCLYFCLLCMSDRRISVKYVHQNINVT